MRSGRGLKNIKYMRAYLNMFTLFRLCLLNCIRCEGSPSVSESNIGLFFDGSSLPNSFLCGRIISGIGDVRSRTSRSTRLSPATDVDCCMVVVVVGFAIIVVEGRIIIERSRRDGRRRLLLSAPEFSCIFRSILPPLLFWWIVGYCFGEFNVGEVR